MQLEQSFTTTAAPTVRLESVAGNLTIHGSEEARVWVRGNSANLRAYQEGDTVTVTTDGDCRVHVPLAAKVVVGSVSGDAQLTDTHGELNIASISGNLRLTSVDAAQIGNVSGDLTVRQADGAVTARNVSGNAVLIGVRGAVAVTNCSGDFLGKGIAGDISGRASGDIRLSLLSPAGVVNCNAAGDVRCRVPADFQGQVKLSCRGDIRVKRLDVPITRARQNAEFALGEGRGALTLAAGGDILLAGPRLEGEDDEDGIYIGVELREEMAERAGELVQQVVEQVETQVESLARQLDEKLATLGSGDEIAAKVQIQIQNVLRMAEEKIAAATRRAEEQSRAAERRAERHAGFRHGTGPIIPPVPPRPPQPKPPAGPTDEERMQVLRMLEEGKISVEQAEKLLAAMGG